MQISSLRLFKDASILQKVRQSITNLKDTPTSAGSTPKLQKIEQIKVDSHYLRDPLEAELKNEEVFVGHDAGKYLSNCNLTLKLISSLSIFLLVTT